MRTVLIGLLILGALCLLFSSAEVSAWGIAFSTNDITVYSGDESSMNLNLQNFVGEETKKIYVRFKGDSDIASIVDAEEYYLLKPRTSEDITLKFTIPKPAKKSYEVDVEFLAQSTDAGVSLASAKIVTFRITVPDGTLVQEQMLKEPEDEGEELSKLLAPTTNPKAQGPTGLVVYSNKPAKPKPAKNYLLIGALIAGLAIVIILLIILMVRLLKKET